VPYTRPVCRVAMVTPASERTLARTVYWNEGNPVARMDPEKV